MFQREALHLLNDKDPSQTAEHTAVQPRSSSTSSFARFSSKICAKKATGEVETKKVRTGSFSSEPNVYVSMPMHILYIYIYIHSTYYKMHTCATCWRLNGNPVRAEDSPKTQPSRDFSPYRPYFPQPWPQVGHMLGSLWSTKIPL